MKGWERVYKTQDHYKASLVFGYLKNNNIDTVILNKQDRLYIVVGFIELYVKCDDAHKAIYLINQLDEEFNS